MRGWLPGVDFAERDAVSLLMMFGATLFCLLKKFSVKTLLTFSCSWSEVCSHPFTPMH